MRPLCRYCVIHNQTTACVKDVSFFPDEAKKQPLGKANRNNNSPLTSVRASDKKVHALLCQKILQGVLFYSHLSAC